MAARDFADMYIQNLAEGSKLCGQVLLVINDGCYTHVVSHFVVAVEHALIQLLRLQIYQHLSMMVTCFQDFLTD